MHQGVKHVSDALQEEVTPNEKYEHSEMLLYRAMVLDEGGNHTEALTHLDLCQVPCASQNGNCYRDVCSKHADSCRWCRLEEDLDGLLKGCPPAWGICTKAAYVRHDTASLEALQGATMGEYLSCRCATKVWTLHSTHKV